MEFSERTGTPFLRRSKSRKLYGSSMQEKGPRTEADAPLHSMTLWQRGLKEDRYLHGFTLRARTITR